VFANTPARWKQPGIDEESRAGDRVPLLGTATALSAGLVKN
jgi:hypothetical protein